MVKPKWFSKIIYSRKTRSNDVSTISHVIEKKGSRKKRFVLKRLIPGKENKMRNWKEIHGLLRKLNIPTVKEFKEYDSGVKTIVQKDYTWTLKGRAEPAFSFYFMNQPGGEKILIAMMRDFGLMHKNGIVTSSKEKLFAPWLVYKKPNGKLDRVVTDFGSLSIDKRSVQQKNRFGKYALTVENFSRIEEFFRYTSPDIRSKAFQAYFDVFPDSPFRKKYASLLK